MSSREPITNLRINRQIETDKDGNNTLTSTAKINFQVTGNFPNFKLSVECNNGCKGLILIPCSNYKWKSNDEATIAENVYNASFSKTGWNVTIPRNFVGGQIEFDFNGDLQASREKHYFEILALMHDFEDLKSIKWTSGDHSGKIAENEGTNPSHEESNKSRFEWVNTILTSLKRDPPQFHPKQQATIEALESFSPERKDITVSYVGLDDASNMMTSMKMVKDAVRKKGGGNISLQLRRLQEHDVNADSSFIEELAKTWVSEFNVIPHNSNWGSNDLIIDTYTAQDWPIENEDDLICYIKDRYESLRNNGLLIIIYPKKEQAPFKKTHMLLNDIDGIKERINDDLRLTADVKTLGISNVLTLKKSQSADAVNSFISNIKNELAEEMNIFSVNNTYGDESTSKPSSGPPTSLPVAPKVPRGDEPINEPTNIRISTKFNVEKLYELENWKDYAQAVRNLGQPESMDYPIETPVMQELRSHLINEALEKFRKNFVILQAHPGWGKTSTLGAVLFPENNSREKAVEFSGYKIWAGKFDDIYDFAMSFGNEGRVNSGLDTILIVDDYHKSMIEYELDELHQKACEISAKVAALIVTCQKDPMGGNITMKSPMLENRAEAFECDVFTPNYHQNEMAYHDFVDNLLKNTKCIKVSENGLPDINDAMYNLAVQWGEIVKDKLFTEDNIIFGKYSPRDAINDLEKCRKRFVRQGVSNIEGFVDIFDDRDDDPMDLMVV